MVLHSHTIDSTKRTQMHLTKRIMSHDTMRNLPTFRHWCRSKMVAKADIGRGVVLSDALLMLSFEASDF